MPTEPTPTPPFPEAPLRDAAAVVLWRERGGRRELFWVRRGREVALGGGFYAMPGGRVDPEDARLADRLAPGLADGALRVAAVRELFEETGVLLARPAGEPAARERERRALLARGPLDSAQARPFDSARGGPFDAALERLGAAPELEVLHPAGRWKTPPFARPRYDTRFFLAALPEGQDAQVWPGELADGEWIAPAEALRRWREGRALLHPPALHLLRCLERAGPPECLAAMNAHPFADDFVATRIEFQEGVLLVPLHAPTLPPWTHVNCYVVGGEELVVVDPGSAWEGPQRELARLCDALRAEGRIFREILITHAHHDHVGGVEALRRRLGVPVRASEAVARALAGEVRVDGVVEDGERLALAGGPGLVLRALATPGHARGHLAFLDETTGALLAGDLVAGQGTVVVDPPDGHMADYVASLRRLRALGVTTIHPAHGPTVVDGPAKLDEYLAHRLDRENQVIGALAKAGTATAEELVPHVYSDVAPALHPLAARSLLAELEKLEHEGKAARDGERWTLLRGA